jgi:hypothetical protein
MHDEDNALGLKVWSQRNGPGFPWTAYGDKRLLDKVDVSNDKICQIAVQASADEIFTAWTSQQAPTYQTALSFTPSLAVARGNDQQVAPLFTFESTPKRRADIDKRCAWSFTSDYWYATTATLLATSKYFKYPMGLTPDCHVDPKPGKKVEENGNGEKHN